MHIFQKKKIQNECYLKKKKSTPWRCVSCGEDKAGGWYCACCTGPRTLLVFFFLNKYQQQKTACFISVCVCVFFFYRGWPYGRKLYINKKTQNIFQLKKKKPFIPKLSAEQFFRAINVANTKIIHAKNFAPKSLFHPEKQFPTPKKFHTQNISTQNVFQYKNTFSPPLKTFSFTKNSTTKKRFIQKKLFPTRKKHFHCQNNFPSQKKKKTNVSKTKRQKNFFHYQNNFTPKKIFRTPKFCFYIKTITPRYFFMHNIF